MGLEGLGRLPGEKKLVVGSEPGPTSYTTGTGIVVRLDLGTLTKTTDIIAAWLLGPPRYSISVSGWWDNYVRVLLGYANCSACSAGTGFAKFAEVSSGVDVSDISAFVAGMGR